MIEIERKFLVNGFGFKKQAQSKSKITQGFLNTNPNRTVRIRIANESAFITVKGKSSSSGLSRFEWEKGISLVDALALLKLAENKPITKWRYNVVLGNHCFQVDEFLDENAGLLVAEVELSTESEFFLKPDWLGKEVTGQIKYYNSYINQHPYNTWEM